MLSLLSSLEEGEDDDEDDLLLAFKFGFALCNEETSIHKAGDYFNKGGNTTVELMLLLKMMFEVGCTSFEVPVIHHTLEVPLALIQSTSCSGLEMDGKRNFRVSLFQRPGDFSSVMMVVQAIMVKERTQDKESFLEEAFFFKLLGVECLTHFLYEVVRRETFVLKLVQAERNSEDEGNFSHGSTSKHGNFNHMGIAKAPGMDAGEEERIDDVHAREEVYQPHLDGLAPDGVKRRNQGEGHLCPHMVNGGAPGKIFSGRLFFFSAWKCSDLKKEDGGEVGCSTLLLPVLTGGQGTDSMEGGVEGHFFGQGPEGISCIRKGPMVHANLTDLVHKAPITCLMEGSVYPLSCIAFSNLLWEKVFVFSLPLSIASRVRTFGLCHLRTTMFHVLLDKKKPLSRTAFQPVLREGGHLMCTSLPCKSPFLDMGLLQRAFPTDVLCSLHEIIFCVLQAAKLGSAFCFFLFPFMETAIPFDGDSIPFDKISVAYSKDGQLIRVDKALLMSGFPADIGSFSDMVQSTLPRASRTAGDGTNGSERAGLLFEKALERDNTVNNRCLECPTDNKGAGCLGSALCKNLLFHGPEVKEEAPTAHARCLSRASTSKGSWMFGKCSKRQLDVFKRHVHSDVIFTPKLCSWDSGKCFTVVHFAFSTSTGPFGPLVMDFNQRIFSKGRLSLASFNLIRKVVFKAKGTRLFTTRRTKDGCTFCLLQKRCTFGILLN